MVAIKYGNVDVMKILLKDERVDMSRMDGNGRSLAELIGVANSCCTEETKRDMFEMIRSENNKREIIRKKKIKMDKSKKNMLYNYIHSPYS